MLRAIELGVDQIEIDTHLTKDKKIAVIHDSILDRTTNGHGFIGDYTLAEL
ncbi:MAG: glycerophosphodiester phosphodiesterase, partial [Thermoleophilia bacterium]|nr:glycerophosphodiester phosphodiesterase [Thermoleophilia bacterium]